MSGVRRRIMHLTYSLEIGGLEVMILELLRRLDRNRYIPSVCTMKPGGELEREFSTIGIAVHNCRKKEGIDLSFPFRLAGLLNRERIEILHTHNYSPWLYGGVGCRLAGKVRLVHTEHSNLDSKQKAALIGERAVSHITESIVADSRDVDVYLRSLAGFNAKRIEIVYNGVDVDKFYPTKTGVLRGGEKSVRIGIVARLVPVKNHEILLRAFRLILDENPNGFIRLDIIGDGPLRGKLEELSRFLGISDAVEFIGFRRDVADILRKLDIFVLCSESEGLPLTLLEAMATGLPVVATDVGGNKEIVVDSLTGYIVPPRDPAAIAASIMKLIRNPMSSNAMAKNGRQRVEERFSLGEMTSRYESIYDRLLT